MGLFFLLSISLLTCSATLVLASPIVSRVNSPVVNITTCNGQKYVYEQLAGYGKLPSDARDKYGDTIGGMGSSIALEKRVSTRAAHEKGSYSGILYTLPDRGWNTQGTVNTQSRIHKFTFTFTISNATAAQPAAPNFQLTYLDTLLLTGPDGTPLSGLDPTGTISYQGFPRLPLVKYSGNGFGQDGPGDARIPLDPEGLVLGDNGTFWVSDEYGPYVYQFDEAGKMLQAIRPPNAFIPIRNGTESFSAASPPIYDLDSQISPENPTSGRANNQGFEALTRSSDGQYLYTMLQSSTIQDGGSSSSKRRNTRLLKYRANANNTLQLVAEYAVQLPLLPTGKVASQSEMHYISDTQFLVLSRDSGAGHGASKSESMYRNADVIDISNATNVMGTSDAFDGRIANKDGILKGDIVPATYCPWLSYNNNAELSRFGLHNGGAQDTNLLNEKWESFALLPVDQGNEEKDGDDGLEYFLLSMSDNDFITQNGFINFGNMSYADESGFNVDTQILVFRVRLPSGSNPL